MKDNSGSGKAKNNNHDVTLDEHEGPPRDPKDSAFDIGGDTTVRGETPSPSGRGRGETASSDRGLSHDGHESR